MATLSAGYTLLEMAKSIAPDGTQMTIAEIMAKEMAIFYDIPWFPSNDIWSHKSLRQAKLSSGTWRGINEYVAAGTTLTDEVLDVIGIVEDFAVYDKLWIDRQPDPQKARMGRARMYIEGMAQSICSAFIYGNNRVTPKQPHGLAPRLASLGRYVLGASGTGSDVTSIYVVTWGEGRAYGVYPKFGDSPSGEFPVLHQDMGVKVDTNSSGYKLVVYEDNFKFEGGLVIEDPRCVGRIANIESAGTTNIFDEDLLIRLINRMKVDAGTRMYANETITTQMQILLKDKTNVNFTPGGGAGLSGEPIVHFQGIPVRKIDSAILLDTESAIT
ncbi:MAG: major capsid protein [Candidatus Omnitrophota bacterium]